MKDSALFAEPVAPQAVNSFRNPFEEKVFPF